MLIVILYSAVINAIFLSVCLGVAMFEMRHAAFILQNVDFKDENKVVHKVNTINFNLSCCLVLAGTSHNIVVFCRPHHDEMIHRPNQ